MIRAAGLALILTAGPVLALELALPGTARKTVERNTAPDRFAAPVGLFRDGRVPTLTVEGEVRRTAWRVEAPGLTPLQVLRPLRDQVEAAGYKVMLDCAASECGGYDFRFATEVLPGPNMYVNIRDYHMLTARKGDADAPSEMINILTSTSRSSAYVQIIQAGKLETVVEGIRNDPTPEPARTPQVAANPDSDFEGQMLGRGHAVLRGLDFESGTSDLGAGPFASLEALADFLVSNSGIRIALVGHTDSVGSLDANVALSRQRAQSVRRRMIEQHGIAPDRMDAEGMGYLAPVASNLDAAGRDANRRVEAIVLSSQ